MNENSFFPVLRTLSRHPSVLGSPGTYRIVLFTILDYMAWEKITMDDHGKLIELKPGQMLTTIRGLAELSGTHRRTVEKSLARFSSVKILGQEQGHTKTIITILPPYIYDKEKEYGGTKMGTRWGQDGDTNNKNTNKEKINIKKESQFSAIEKQQYRQHVFLTKTEYELLVDQFGSDKTMEMLNKHNFHKIKSGIQYPSDYNQILAFSKFKKEETKVQPLGKMYEELKF